MRFCVALTSEREAPFFKIKTTEAGRRSALPKTRTRRALREAGKHEPQEYLMIWPRRAMLAWLSRDGAMQALDR
jgi:hypothetical protein